MISQLKVKIISKRIKILYFKFTICQKKYKRLRSILHLKFAKKMKNKIKDLKKTLLKISMKRLRILNSKVRSNIKQDKIIL